jgi:glycerate 2-kinase
MRRAARALLVGRAIPLAHFLCSQSQHAEPNYLLGMDTDGIDGSEDNAGAILSPTSLKRGGDARALLAKHDSYGFFSALGDLVSTGPTLTDVNDYRAILVA